MYQIEEYDISMQFYKVITKIDMQAQVPDRGLLSAFFLFSMHKE